MEDYTTPILFIIFNRPNETKMVFDAIKKVKPRYLYIAADGPRDNHKEDLINCNLTRSITDGIDWDCNINLLFSDKNQGCKKAVINAINWFFSNVDEGIILEDDCLPSFSFFEFCAQILERYRNDKRIMMVSGDNFLNNKLSLETSYYYSRFAHIWGWATWKRAWNMYDQKIINWPRLKERRYLYNYLNDEYLMDKWTEIFDLIYENKIDTWDYQWQFACWIQNALCIMPSVNLVQNIGFSINGTHTFKDSEKYSLEGLMIRFPLIHPESFLINYDADMVTQRFFYGESYGVKNYIKSLMKNLKLLCR